MGGDNYVDELLDALTVLVAMGGVAAVAAAFGIGNQDAELGTLCATAGLILAAMALTGLELAITVRDLFHSALLSARAAETRRYAELLRRQRALNSIAFQFGYAGPA